MLRNKFYRWWRVVRGARSFVLKKDGQINTYILMQNVDQETIDRFLADGYEEEWPIPKRLQNG